MTSIPLHFLSATQALAGLHAGNFSSRDLLESYIARVEAFNPGLNAIVDQNLASARARADKADQARRQGEHWGPLHGLPMTVKDTWEVPGMTCTAGAPEYRQHRPTQPGPVIQRVLEAGAIPFGKTNVPYKALDVQSFNPIFGTTRNPWDPTRTCGGSSGGAAVALATGMSPLEIGSDIGGSIRIPAHFCGIYGHKATHGLISLRGHIPGEPGHLSEPPLGVPGPMARSAEDLRLLLDIMAADANLPLPRHERLDQYRVLMWVDDPDCPIDLDMTAVYQELAQRLRAAGAQIDIGAPPGLGLHELYPPYFKQMGALMGAWLTGAERRAQGMVAPLGRATAPLMRHLGKVMCLPHSLDRFVDGMTMKLGGWFDVVEHANHLREAFIGTVLNRYDIILAPPTFTPAFEHVQGLMANRRITVNGQRRHYSDLFMWIAPATLMGLPATSAPVALTPSGLPVNVQIIGAPRMDRETVQFAALLAEVTDGIAHPRNAVFNHPRPAHRLAARSVPPRTNV